MSIAYIAMGSNLGDRKENLLEAVIGLPTNLFYGTGIPAAILIFNKGKKNRIGKCIILL